MEDNGSHMNSTATSSPQTGLDLNAKANHTSNSGSGVEQEYADILVIDEPKLPSYSPAKLEDIPVMMHDPNLPTGWSRKVVQRTTGASAGKYDVYLYSPDNKKIRSKTDLMIYFQKSNLDYNPDDFDFTVRGKANTNNIRKANLSSQKSRSRKSNAASPTKLREQNNANNSAAHKAKLTQKNKDKHSATPGASAPKMVVKFDFPVPRLKRTLYHPKKKSSNKKLKADLPESDENSNPPITNIDLPENRVNVHTYSDKSSTAFDDSELTSSSMHSSIDENAILEVE